ncbi:hypothetical protein ACLK19_29190 [Escherichia coli]
MDGSQKVTRSVCWTRRACTCKNGGSWRHLGAARPARMRYTQAWMSRVMPLTWSTHAGGVPED